MGRNVRRISAIFVFIFVCQNEFGLVDTSREEIIFYREPQFQGDRVTITLAAGCYNFDWTWDNRIASVDTQDHCVIAWDQPKCEGPSVKLAPGFRGRTHLREVRFDNRISSISACWDESTLRNRERMKRIKSVQQMSMGSGMEVWKVALQEHNKYRRMHGVPDLLGDPMIHEAAQKHADYLASNNKFETSTGNEFGENLSTNYKSNELDAIREVVKNWYDKIELYNFLRPESNTQRPKSAQFSSIVWKSTKYMGVGVAWNNSQRKWIIVCFYDPPATRTGSKENVFPRTTI